MRLPGDINKMIFDKRTEIEGNEIDELEAWIEDLDAWIEHYQNGITEIFRLCGVPISFQSYEKMFEGVDESNRPTMSQALDPVSEAINQVKWNGKNREHLNTLIVWTGKSSRAQKAKEQAEKQLKVMRENFIPNQNMFHKWGYTTTTSQNSHNPFKIN